ncbi:SRPBCC family protein [Streptomyces sp. UG1]|uniref:SRPBCC family protein n=1 Tax=Streptomyces sp. UG1 TaxID=3417652 RepID=UPI003CED64AA
MDLGFVGAGRMGRPMVERLVQAGHRVRGYVRDAGAARALTRAGAEPVTALADAARCAEAVLLCLYSDAQVREVCLDGSLLDALPADAVLVMHTTGSPRTARAPAGRGAAVVDAPVSGGPHDIAAGRLTVLAGGGPDAVGQVRPALQAYADPLLHVGPLGAGQLVKLLNNLLFAGQIGLLADAVCLGRQLGVAEEVLLAALPHVSAASRAATGAKARGSVAAFAASAGPFLRKDLAVAAEAAAERRSRRVRQGSEDVRQLWKRDSPKSRTMLLSWPCQPDRRFRPMAHFPKPSEGSWTEHFKIDTAPVSYADSISPEFYEKERDAVFRRTWLNVGRVEQLPRKGRYFTKELDAARASVVVVRGMDGEVRAFHNVCRHRGNKLVWDDYPREETKGTCRAFTCKYHAWRYDLAGKLTFVQQESEFFDIDKSKYGLLQVQTEVWEGFIFVNLDPDNTTPLKDYLGKFAQGIDGYPFHKLTQVHKYRAEIGSNWKLFIDAFAEFYHAPILHSGQYEAGEAAKIKKYGYEALAYDIDGPHSMVSSWGGIAPPKEKAMVKPIERALRSGLFGPWDAPDIGLTAEELPPAINPIRSKVWGMDSFVFFPNFMLLIWRPNWVLTYHYWPTSYHTHIFEGTAYFVPPKNAFQRLQQELAVVSFKEYGLQDGNTLEATQTMLESRTLDTFPLCDQEVLLRHLHSTAQNYVRDYEQRQSTAPATAS